MDCIINFSYLQYFCEEDLWNREDWLSFSAPGEPRSDSRTNQHFYQNCNEGYLYNTRVQWNEYNIHLQVLQLHSSSEVCEFDRQCKEYKGIFKVKLSSFYILWWII